MELGYIMLPKLHNVINRIMLIQLYNISGMMHYIRKLYKWNLLCNIHGVILLSLITLIEFTLIELC